jgi:multidrug efflux pump subunit AcrB
MKPRFMITVALMMAMIGAISWGTMTRQEDPDMPDLWGMVVVSFPGADVETMERLVIDPVEERLAEVDDMRQVMTDIRNGFASMELELLGGTDDIDEAWDDVREALDKAAREFPAGAFPPVLDRDMNDQDAVVLAITGSEDPAVLRSAARRLRDKLLGLQVVSKVNMVGDPGDQVRVEIDDVAVRQLGLDFQTLATILSSRNQVLSGGTIRLGDKSVTLRPRSEFRSVQEIEDTPILLPSGGTIPLGI